MNKKFSTLAALLLASGAGYTLVQAALESQTVFKPGVNYVIGEKPSSGTATTALTVTVDAGGLKVATAPVDFAAGTTWTVASVEGKRYLSFGESFLSTDLNLTNDKAKALEITLATTGEIKAGAKFLSIKAATDKTDATLELTGTVTSASLYMYDTDANTVLTTIPTDTDKKVAVAQKSAVWTTTSTLMKGGTVVPNATWSATSSDNTPWVLAADGKISSGTGSTFLVAGADGAVAAADGADATAGSALTMAEGGSLKINGLFLEANNAATICNTVATNTPLYLYAVNATTGAISTTYETEMPTMVGNKYIIAPALITTAIPANGYVTATAASTTLGVVAVGDVADEDVNADWDVVPAKKDSLYLHSEVGYLSFSVDATGAVTGYSVSETAETATMYAMTEDNLISKLGENRYSLTIDASTSTAEIAKLTADPTPSISVLTDFAPAIDETITNGKTATNFDKDGMVIGEANDGDYVYFIIDGKYVSVADNGSIEMVTAPTTAAAARKASWIVGGSENAATYQSVAVAKTETSKYLAVSASDMKATITTPFQLASAGSKFGYDAARLQVTTGTKKGYLVSVTAEDGEEIDVTYSVQANPDVANTTPADLTLQLSGIQAPAATTVDVKDVPARKLVTNWETGKYYFLADNAGNLVKSDGSVIKESATTAFSGKITDKESLKAVSAYLWKMNEVENTATGQWSYSFTNLDSEGLLIVESQKAFISNTPFKYEEENGLVFKLKKDFLQVDNNNKLVLSSYTAGKDVPTFGLYEAVNVTYTTADLNNRLGNSFILGSTVPEGKTIEESALINQTLRAINLTVGSQTAQYFVVANTLTITDNAGETSAISVKDNQTMLKDAEFVVVGTDQYGIEVAATGKGFAYATKTGAELFDFEKDKAKAGLDKAQFTTEYSLALGIPKEIKDINSLIITQTIDFGKGKITVRPQGMTAKVKNAEGVMEDKYFVLTMDVNSPVNWSVINFDGNNGVAKDHFDGKAFNAKMGNTKENANEYYSEHAGWIYGPQMNIVDPAKSNINLNGAEGQFVIRWGEKTFNAGTANEYIQEGFWMYNRESTYDKFLGRSIFEVRDANNNLTNKYYLASLSKNDTIELIPATLCHARLGGYGHYLDASDDTTIFDAVSLAKTAYRIGIKNGAFDGIAYISNSSVHNNQLSVNIKDEDGLRFFFVPTTNNSADTVAYGLNNSGKKYYEVVADAAKDSLYRVSYAIQERTTKRFVGFNSDQKLELNSTVKDAAKAQQFFIKEKGDGKFVIVVRNDDNHNSNSHPSFDQKVFANIGDASLHYTNIYDGNIADEFVLDTITAPKYADILKTLKKDSDTTLVKINLYSVENLVGTSSYMLTPGANNFLMEGVPAKSLKAAGGKEYPAAGFDLVVDTAYVNRLGNTMPMYYLAMNGAARLDSVGPLHSGDKDENGHAIDCKHFNGNDTVVGKYLFAMYDSIYFGTDKNIKPEDNCYHYTNTEHFARLRFVDAVHVKDTMIIGNDTNIAKNVMKPGIVKTNIPGNRQYDWLNGYALADDLKKAMEDHQAYIKPVYDNFGLFAFEINPANNEEYAIYNPATDLYVAYINGNVVLAPQASYYTMTKSGEGTLVDNENVETTEVTVIAGNGQVAIKNAQGKTVVICNLLGQTLANTVITSDNATINVPAGIAVVAVEGEEAVKAIVK